MISHVTYIIYIALLSKHAALILNQPQSPCFCAAEIFHFRLIRIRSNARNSIFQFHYTVHNTSKKPLGLFWRFRPSTGNYNNKLYYNLEEKVEGLINRENDLKFQRLVVLDIIILSCDTFPSANTYKHTFLSCRMLDKSVPSTISLRTSSDKGSFLLGLPAPKIFFAASQTLETN